MMRYWKWIVLVSLALLVFLSWGTGVVDTFTSPYSHLVVYRADYISTEKEYRDFVREWTQYIMDTNSKWLGMVTIPGATTTFVEISWLERKVHWWDLW